MSSREFSNRLRSTTAVQTTIASTASTDLDVQVDVGHLPWPDASAWERIERSPLIGADGPLRLEGTTHVAGASSEERRTRLFGTCRFQPAKGPPEVWQPDTLDVTRAALDAFARAARGGAAYPIPLDEMVHGAAVTEAIIRSTWPEPAERTMASVTAAPCTISSSGIG